MLLKMVMKVNISLIQIDIIAGEPDKNFSKVKSFLENLPVKDNHIVILPELWISGYSYNKLKKCSDYFKANLNILKNIAKNKNINISGSIPWEETNFFYNRTIFINSNGEISSHYDKIHLFKPLEEDKFFKEGENISFVKDNFNIGLMLCYDLRFPELARKLALKGSDIILVSAEWPLERIEHWRLLNKSRAVENQVFVASCNRVGISYNIEFGGHSTIISPSGNTIAELSTSEESGTFEIDLSEIKKIKENFDILEDVRIFK